MVGTSSVRPTKGGLLRRWNNSVMLICVTSSKINPAIYGSQQWVMAYSGIIRRRIRWSSINVYRETAPLSERMKWQAFRRIAKVFSGFLRIGEGYCVLTPKRAGSGHTLKRTVFRTTWPIKWWKTHYIASGSEQTVDWFAFIRKQTACKSLPETMGCLIISLIINRLWLPLMGLSGWGPSTDLSLLIRRLSAGTRLSLRSTSPEYMYKDVKLLSRQMACNCLTVLMSALILLL